MSAIPELVPVLVVAALVAAVFWKFHVLAEAAKPLPTKDELAARETDDIHGEGTSLIAPYFILAGKPRKPVTSRADRANIARGVALLREVIERSPTNWAAVWCVGKALQASDDAGAALEHFERAVELNPQHVDVAREYIAQCLVLGSGEAAVAASQRLCRMHPADAGLRANLAYALLIAGDVAAARAEIEAAVAAAPDDPISGRLRELIVAVQEGRAPRPERMEHPR